MKGDGIILASELFGSSWPKEDCVIRGITCDSRKIKPGYVFVCIRGYKDSGYRYIKEAEMRGAEAVIADSIISCSIPVLLFKDTRAKMAELAKKIYQNPDESLIMIGVTGTNGKTTVTHLVRDILNHADYNAGIIGTNGCCYNRHLTDDAFSTSTTPESCDLWSIMKNMKDLGAQSIIMEVSSHALELDRVCGLKYRIGAFTNLTQDHLDFHKNMENYFQAKRKLFCQSELCVINTDDEYGKRLYEEFGNKSVSYGMENADITASDIAYTSHGVDFKISYGNKTTDAYINIPGKFSVYNALCAFGIGRQLKIKESLILDALRECEGVTGRVEKIKTDTDYSVIIDYAHTPDGLVNILKTVREFTKGRVITLFGCGGNRDEKKRPLMGKISAELSDVTVLTSDNPRMEDPVKIIKDIEKGISGISDSYVIIPDRYEAIKYALNIAVKGDTVLLAGKGHEDYIIKGTKKIHFDEREAVKQILKTANKTGNDERNVRRQ